MRRVTGAGTAQGAVPPSRSQLLGIFQYTPGWQHIFPSSSSLDYNPQIDCAQHVALLNQRNQLLCTRGGSFERVSPRICEVPLISDTAHGVAAGTVSRDQCHIRRGSGTNAIGPAEASSVVGVGYFVIGCVRIPGFDAKRTISTIVRMLQQS